jgi:ferredoxin-fold anticodon binding domain-containing protein
MECFSILDIGLVADMMLPSFVASGKHVGVAMVYYRCKHVGVVRFVAIEHLILEMDQIQGLPCVCVSKLMMQNISHELNVYLLQL